APLASGAPAVPMRPSVRRLEIRLFKLNAKPDLETAYGPAPTAPPPWRRRRLSRARRLRLIVVVGIGQVQRRLGLAGSLLGGFLVGSVERQLVGHQRRDVARLRYGKSGR